MKTVIIYLVVSFFTLNFCQAQETKTDASRTENLEKQKEAITQEEKEALKAKVEKINSRLEDGEIDAAEAERQKKEAAHLHALNIENRVAILENKSALEARNPDKQVGYVGIFGKDRLFEVKLDKDVKAEDRDDDEDDYKYDRRTYTELVVAAGLNNALSDGQSISESDYKIGGSRFFEIGLAWRTRVFQNSNWLRFKYGFSFQFNGLKPTDNRYFVEQGDQTVLEEYPIDLEKSKFRTDNLVFPVHFEFGPSTKQESARSIRYYTEDKIRIGVGGYAGFNIGERQKLKYKEDGEKTKEKLKYSYNTSDFIYGLSAYIGWNSAALYAKYDLNPIFQDNPVEQHNISVGLRFDLD